MGLQPWLDTENLLPGQRWKVAVRQAIEGSSHFIALLSTHAVSKRGFVQSEVRQALEILSEFPDNQIFIIPVRIDECKPSHERLKELHWVDLFPSFDAGVRAISAALAARSGSEDSEQTNKSFRAAGDTRHTESSRISGLELIDVSFGKSSGDRPEGISRPSPDCLDLKVRNRGQKIAYIKRATINVKKIWELITVSQYCAAVFQTGRYDVVLPIKSTPYELEVNLSQAVTPNQVDRFGLCLRLDTESRAYNQDNDYIVELDVSLYYDTRTTPIVSDLILFGHDLGLQKFLSHTGFCPLLGGLVDSSMYRSLPQQIDSYYGDPDQKRHARAKKLRAFWREEGRRTVDRNRKLIDELRALRAIRSSVVDEILTSLKEATDRYAAVADITPRSAGSD